MDNTDLFLVGDTLTIEKFGFTMSVTSMTETEATISITY